MFWFWTILKRPFKLRSLYAFVLSSADDSLASN
jgi:hypothetical protein